MASSDVGCVLCAPAGGARQLARIIAGCETSSKLLDLVVKLASSRLADAMDAASAELDRAEGLGVDSLASCGASGPALGLELLSTVAADVQTHRGLSLESGVGRKRKGSSSRYHGVCWDKTVQAHGSGVERNFTGEAISEPPVSKGEERKQRGSSRHRGVHWNKASSSWFVSRYEPQTKRKQHIGTFDSEEDAARAYDFAAVQAHGPGAKRNFPAEAISELPVGKGEERKQSKTSCYLGVSWDKSVWKMVSSGVGCVLCAPAGAARQLALVIAGCETSSKLLDLVVKLASSRLADAMDAASAELDRAPGLGVNSLASCDASGPALGLELPSAVAADVRAQDAEPEGGAPPESGVGRKRKGSSSRYHGVCWDNTSSSWRVQLWDPQSKRLQHIGSFASEEDAARAHDFAAVQAHRSGEVISEPPATKGEERKQQHSSRFLGVCWNKASSSWLVQLWDPLTKRDLRVGSFASEEDAARAYDRVAVQARGLGAKRNFPGEAIGVP
ncbi:hypothetical protein FOA52_014030 [Chlamydomonas sp. UWO 241]|nr:hypothetical protein FOA52_014030 [Chlamydomonas sp. UWO 241]